MKRKISELQVGDVVDFASLPMMASYAFAFGTVEDIGPGQKMSEVPGEGLIDDPDDPGPYVIFEHWGDVDMGTLPEVEVLDEAGVEAKIKALGDLMDNFPSDAKEYAGRAQQITWCHEYGEPGYDDPARGILFGNWNYVSRKVCDWLESLGYELEWEDEWTTDDNCKAYRTSPSSYGWTPSLVYDEDCHTYTRDDHNGIIEAFAMTDKGHQPHLLPDWVTDAELQAEGFQKVEGADREHGFHPGQDDTPEKDAKPLFDKGAAAVVFRQTDQGQFDMRWDVWVKWNQTYRMIVKGIASPGVPVSVEGDYASETDARTAFKKSYPDADADCVLYRLRCPDNVREDDPVKLTGCGKEFVAALDSTWADCPHCGMSFEPDNESNWPQPGNRLAK